MEGKDISLKFLREKYNLDKSSQVEKAVKYEDKRREREKGAEAEPIENTPEARIQVYLDRLHEIVDRPKGPARERGLKALKRLLHMEVIVKPDVALDEYIKHQKQMAKDRGHGDIYISEDVRARLLGAVRKSLYGDEGLRDITDLENQERQIAEEVVTKIRGQKRSYDAWFDYLTSEDANVYPDWMRYFVMRSVSGLSAYNYEEKRFPSRDVTTLNPFPKLHAGAMAKVLDMLLAHEEYRDKIRAEKENLKQQGKSRSQKRRENRLIAEKIQEIKKEDPKAEIDISAIRSELGIEEEEKGNKPNIDLHEFEIEGQEEYQERVREGLEKQDFATLYAVELEKIKPVEQKMLEQTKGNWVKYERGSSPGPLVESLSVIDTGWCTDGYGTALSQLSRGDFYVFYSNYVNDEGEEQKIPRIAIRMEGRAIAEVRGIGHGQEMDGYMAETTTLKDKLAEFGKEGRSYMKKDEDMRRMTRIYNEWQQQQPLTSEDLRFLYQLNSPIEGFGNTGDKRILEVLEGRDRRQDFAIIFNCTIDQVVEEDKEIKEDTRVVLSGALSIGKFKEFENIVWLDRKVMLEMDEYNLPEEVAHRLIRMNLSDRFVDNIERFEILDHTYIVSLMIEARAASDIPEFLHHVQTLDCEALAKNMIDAGIGWVIPDNLHVFKGINHKDIANRLIEAGDGEWLVTGLDNFEGLNHEDIANKLIKAGDGEYLAAYIFYFKGINHNDIADKLFDAGLGWCVGLNINHFDINHEDTANRLIDLGEGSIVVDVLEMFKGLNHESIANRLIKAGMGKIVAKYLYKFEGLNHEDIANKLIEAGDGEYLAVYIFNFEGINHNDIAYKLIKAGKGGPLAEYIAYFEGLDHNDIVYRLIDAGQAAVIAKYPRVFVNLRPETIKYLIENHGYTLPKRSLKSKEL